MKKIIPALVAFFGLVGAILIWVAITTLPVQILWNLLVPEIFGLTKLGFWQTFGLLVLIQLMFNSGKTDKKKEA